MSEKMENQPPGCRSATIGAKELSEILSMPKRSVLRQQWAYLNFPANGGVRKEFIIEALPLEVRTKIAAKSVSAKIAAGIVETDQAVAQAKDIQAVEAVKADAEQLAAEEKARLDGFFKARLEGQQKFELLPEYKKERANAKLEIVTACVRFTKEAGLGKTAGQEAFILELHQGRIELSEKTGSLIKTTELHVVTLRAWFRAEFEKGKFGLVDHFGSRRGTGTIDTDSRFQGAIVAVIEKAPHIKPGHILKVLQARYPGEVDFGERTVDRWVKRWIAEHKQEYIQMVNPDLWRSTCMAASGDADANITELNQLWEMDSTPGDLMFSDGRYSLIAVIDVKSRRMLILMAKTSRSVAIAALIRKAILAWGIPKVIKTDNGTDYKSKMIRRVLADLDVEQKFCMKFSPEQKPFIERGIGTFSHGVAVELMPNFIGHNVAERKDIDARQTFAQRLLKQGEVIDMKCEASKFQEICDSWCEATYGRSEHSSLDGKSPFQVANEWKGEIRQVPDPRVLDLLIYEDVGTREVLKKGITVDNVWYDHAILGAYVRQTVFVMRNNLDAGRILVFRLLADGGREWLCEAVNAKRAGQDPQKLALAKKIVQRQHNKERREKRKKSGKEWKNVDLAALVIEADKRAAGQVISFPRQTVEHTTPALEAFAQAAAEIADSKGLTPERIEEMNRADPVNPETEKRLAKIIDLQNRRAESGTDEFDEAQARFNQWLVLRERHFQGLTPEEERRWRGYEESDECKGFLVCHNYEKREAAHGLE